MAGSEGKGTQKKFGYFYLNGDLHKVERIDRHRDLAEAFRYRDGAHVVYMWSDVRRDAQRAFRPVQVCRILNISKDTLMNYLRDQQIREPERMVSDGDNQRQYEQRMFSEDDIFDIWELIMNTHIGRPRKDGKISHRRNVPTKAELMKILRDTEVLYYKDPETGEFAPVWKAAQW